MKNLLYLLLVVFAAVCFFSGYYARNGLTLKLRQTPAPEPSLSDGQPRFIPSPPHPAQSAGISGSTSPIVIKQRTLVQRLQRQLDEQWNTVQKLNNDLNQMSGNQAGQTGQVPQLSNSELLRQMREQQAILQSLPQEKTARQAELERGYATENYAIQQQRITQQSVLIRLQQQIRQQQLLVDNVGHRLHELVDTGISYDIIPALQQQYTTAQQNLNVLQSQYQAQEAQLGTELAMSQQALEARRNTQGQMLEEDFKNRSDQAQARLQELQGLYQQKLAQEDKKSKVLETLNAQFQEQRMAYDQLLNQYQTEYGKLQAMATQG